MSQEEYLRQHLSGIPNNTQNKMDDFVKNVNSEKKSGSRTEDLQYLSFDIKQLPCGDFYPEGTVLMVRAAQVREIQSYSMVDDNNFYDVVDKMNDMLAACVRLKNPDGSIATYLNIKDQDRLYLIFLIRELTFQKGNSLTVKSECACGKLVEVELKRENFIFHQIDEKLDQYYDKRNASFFFETVNGKEYRMTPPTIGLQKSFADYIVKENNEKRKPNLAFLKIIPFLIGERNNITYDGIRSKLTEFEKIDDISFQFLNAAVGKMTFGIKELRKTCECGLEVHTEMAFPNGASGLFVIHDAFETLIKK